ncbi:hypothetical protein Bca4012_010296 [Brassica carinata]
MSPRSRSTKTNSSSHSSSGDSPVDEVVALKHDEGVEEDAREAYYKALCGSCPPLRDIPIPRRPPRVPDVPCDVEPVAVLPVRRRRHRSRKGKEVECKTVSGDPSLLGGDPSFVPGEGGRTREFPLPSNFFDGLPPAFTTDESLEDEAKKKVLTEGSRHFIQGMRVFGAVLNGSFRGSRISRFKAEEAERELFRFWKEVEEQSRKQTELHSRALVRAERRGRRAIASEIARRAELFATEFESLKEAQEFVGDFRDCRGLVANLYKSQNPGFSFSSELWDPIEVSEDTVETGAGGNAEDVDEEVDQPVTLFGIFTSGYFDLDY